eukprot:gene21376-25779_t
MQFRMHDALADAAALSLLQIQREDRVRPVRALVQLVRRRRPRQA